MKLLLDAHVHVYPDYPRAQIGEVIVKRITEEQADGAILCLTEKGSDNYFSELGGDEGVFITEYQSYPVAFLQGSQVSSRERLELLFYGQRSSLEDGMEFSEMLEQASGTYALAWGFGKWLGARRRMVKNFSGLKCDSAMRPTIFPEPLLAGNSLLGSDPLPGEVHNILRLGRVSRCSSFPESVRDVIELLEQGGRVFGSRKGLLEVLV